MRTTLTLDDDVAASLSRLQKKEKLSFRELVNRALREGLKQMRSPAPSRKRYRTPSADLGSCLLGNIDDVAEALAVAEGESFR
jgi:hypothetical protein